METRIVHIDTSIFVGKNYNFLGNDFQALIRWANEKKVEIYLTPITVQEVKSNISKDVAKAIQSIQKTRNEAKILRNLAESPISSIFANLDHQEYEEKLFSQFQKFIEDSNAEIAPINEVSTEKIFNLYFEKLSPFGTGKKKSEFPDAFILAALNMVSEQESCPVYVVSKDKDFAEGVKHFPGLIHLDSLEKYLNIVALHYENLAPLASKLMKENEEMVKEAIEEQFLNLGFYLGDQEGEVYGVDVTDITGLEEYLINVDHQGAKFELTPVVEYTAGISYDDLDTASYDSEDKVLIPWRTIDSEVSRKQILQVEVMILFSDIEPYDFEIEMLAIRSPKYDVEVIAEEDGWPYK